MYDHKKLCSHGNSLFSIPHILDFIMLVIFSLKNIKVDNAYEVPLANLKTSVNKPVIIGTNIDRDLNSQSMLMDHMVIYFR